MRSWRARDQEIAELKELLQQQAENIGNCRRGGLGHRRSARHRRADSRRTREPGPHAGGAARKTAGRPRSKSPWNGPACHGNAPVEEQLRLLEQEKSHSQRSRRRRTSAESGKPAKSRGVALPAGAQGRVDPPRIGLCPVDFWAVFVTFALLAFTTRCGGRVSPPQIPSGTNHGERTTTDRTELCAGARAICGLGSRCGPGAEALGGGPHLAALLAGGRRRWFRTGGRRTGRRPGRDRQLSRQGPHGRRTACRLRNWPWPRSPAGIASTCMPATPKRRPAAWNATN